MCGVPVCRSPVVLLLRGNELDICMGYWAVPILTQPSPSCCGTTSRGGAAAARPWCACRSMTAAGPRCCICSHTAAAATTAAGGCAAVVIAVAVAVAAVVAWAAGAWLGQADAAQREALIADIRFQGGKHAWRPTTVRIIN